MKIGVITIHHAKHSYGAALQALATVRVLQSIGHDVTLINYENAYEQAEIKGRGASLRTKAWMGLNRAARIYLYGGWRAPCRKGENLDKMYGCVTAEKYTSVAQMEALTFDTLLVGSDQVWNPDITDGLDDAFLLRFGNGERRVSYASSMGSHCLNAEERGAFQTAFQAFSAISVREAHAKDQLQSITEKEIKVVLDPTLLMTKEDWAREFSIGIRLQAEKYILTYFVAGNLNAYWDTVKGYAEKLRLPLWNVQSHARKGRGVTRAVYAATPGEIVSLIDNAALVITDSFHGTAFSVSFQKPFVVARNHKNPVRVMNLLDSVGLVDGCFTGPEHMVDAVDFQGVDTRLSALRADSIAWLRRAVEGRRAEDG